MNASDVIKLYDMLTKNKINVWIDGGFGVDALLGKQTRLHEDVDIVIQQKDVPKLRELLRVQGYKDVARDDTRAWNFVLGDDEGHMIDIHAIVFDEKNNGLYGPPEKSVMYAALSLTGNGIIDGHPVRCISAEYMVKFHAGYTLDENDRKDVTALCKRFNIPLPEEYREMAKEKA